MRSFTFSDPAFLAGGFTVSVTSSSVGGDSFGDLGAGAASVVGFAAITGFCIGSVPPYTFSWGAISGSSTITASPSNTSGTSFRWDGTVGGGGCYETTFRCTGISSLGRTGVSSPVTVFICTYPGAIP